MCASRRGQEEQTYDETYRAAQWVVTDDTGLLHDLTPGAGGDTWRLKENVGVELLGSLCARVQGSSPAHPVRIEVRIVIPR